MIKGREGKIRPVEELLRRVMPPRYDVMEKLENAARGWESVVGAVLGKQSAPLDIINDELTVVAESPLAGNRLSMMGGNIARALAEKWGLKVTKVKVVVGRIPLRESVRKNSRPAAVRPASVPVREEDVKEFSSLCRQSLPDFPEDAADSLARLRAFFMKRFGKEKR